jgi:hypothetical protein
MDRSRTVVLIAMRRDDFQRSRVAEQALTRFLSSASESNLSIMVCASLAIFVSAA